MNNQLYLVRLDNVNPNKIHIDIQVLHLWVCISPCKYHFEIMRYLMRMVGIICIHQHMVVVDIQCIVYNLLMSIHLRSNLVVLNKNFVLDLHCLFGINLCIDHISMLSYGLNLMLLVYSLVNCIWMDIERMLYHIR